MGNLSNLPILTEIRSDDQLYVDEPVIAKHRNRLRQIIREVIGLPHIPDIILAYNHVKLRWMKPDGNGGVIPR